VPDQIALGIPLGSQTVASSSKTLIEVADDDGTARQLTLTNLDKVLYPAAGFTKAAVVDYYARIAPLMLPHLRRRVLTMVRFPNGVDEESFFEKRCPPHAPQWVRTAVLDGLEGCVVDDLPTLVWIANLAALELHTHQATVEDPDHPTAVVFDLDPGPPAGMLDCCRVAIELRDLLSDLGLTTLVKTSGSKGLHLSVPIQGASADRTKDFARALGQLLAKQDPDRVTIVMTRDLRGGKVFVDWSQNDRHKTTVAAYSLRARHRPLVSAPVAWDEVEAALADDDPVGLELDAAAVLERAERLGDLYAPGAAAEQRLPALT
jgi:bifunctional non-homologous end joining protein LigD